MNDEHTEHILIFEGVTPAAQSRLQTFLRRRIKKLEGACFITGISV